jgi:hypothetical protein
MARFIVFAGMPRVLDGKSSGINFNFVMKNEPVPPA